MVILSTTKVMFFKLVLIAKPPTKLMKQFLNFSIRIIDLQKNN